MSEALSRLSSRFQTVIPKIVRRRLGLEMGDVLRFRVSPDGAIILDKVAAESDDPFASFAEWRSEEDERLYSDL